MRVLQVYCDLGTDCADCGPWTHDMPSLLGEAQASLPVAHLLGLGVEVYVKRTRTVPSFLMPYTNPKQDVDVSGQMHINGNIELGLTQVPSLLAIIFRVIMRVCCLYKDGFPLQRD